MHAGAGFDKLYNTRRRRLLASVNVMERAFSKEISNIVKHRYHVFLRPVEGSAQMTVQMLQDTWKMRVVVKIQRRLMMMSCRFWRHCITMLLSRFISSISHSFTSS